MQENKKKIKLQKLGTIALLCLLVVAFVGSIFCAMILPFSNLPSRVASAYSATADGVLQQASSEFTLRNIPADVTQLCAVFFNVGFVPDFASWDLPYESVQLFNYTYAINSGQDTVTCSVVRHSSSSFESSGISLSADFYYFSIESSTDLIHAMVYCANEDKATLQSLGFTSQNLPISFSYISKYGGGIVNFSSFTVNSTYIDKLVSWVSLSCSFEATVTTIVEEVLSPEYFATRFVTPTGSPSNTVFFNLDIMPKSPKLVEFKTYSSGSTSWYYYDYFQEYGTQDSMIMANDVSTVGWHIDVHKKVLPPNITILGYYVYLRIGMTDIYSYYVSGSDFDTGVISDQKWLVSSNYTFGDLKLYKYDFTGATSYFSLLAHEEGKVLPVDSQFGDSGWNTWLALFDLSKFVSLSADSYINIGYQNAKLYYDELIRDKTQESFLQGKNQGYELGFQEGKAQSSNYTFTSLIGAVFDAPIEAFRGLFNFEILGTNMQGFVLALLTLSVIIVVIKYALGGK